MFSSYEGSAGKLLAGHLLGDYSRLGDDILRQYIPQSFTVMR